MGRVAVRLRAGWARRHTDEGTSLVELMVGMALLSIFMAMFTGAVVAMNNSENKAQAVNITSSQLNQAYLNLDKTVRYATAISTPGVSPAAGSSGDWYVEMQTLNTGTEVCTQVRVDIVAQQLQQRSWNVTGTVAGTPSAWSPTASGISNGNAVAGPTTQPFYLTTPAKAIYQQLTINLAAPSGNGVTYTNSVSTFTFTALNSTKTPPGTPFCQQQGRP